jgi:4-oxalocrotonate tautomerase family enzyme
MPLISIRLAVGRDRDALAKLVAALSAAAADALDVPIERVTVHIFELDDDHIGRGGRLRSAEEAR